MSLESASDGDGLEAKSVEVFPDCRDDDVSCGWRSHLALQEGEWAGRQLVL